MRRAGLVSGFRMRFEIHLSSWCSSRTSGDLQARRSFASALNPDCAFDATSSLRVFSRPMASTRRRCSTVLVRTSLRYNAQQTHEKKRDGRNYIRATFITNGNETSCVFSSISSVKVSISCAKLRASVKFLSATSVNAPALCARRCASPSSAPQQLKCVSQHNNTRNSGC